MSSAVFSVNEKIAEKLVPYWNRALVRLVDKTNSAHQQTVQKTFSTILRTMAIPFASHQEQLDFLKNQDRDRQVMRRAYHNINHVLELCELYDKEVLIQLKKNQQQQSGENSSLLLYPEEDVIFLVAFFHDVVYDAKKGDNEEKSDEMWKDFCVSISDSSSTSSDTNDGKNNNLQQIQQKVSDIILATKSHMKWKPQQEEGTEKVAQQQQNLNTATFLDMDLAILGAPEERYREYATQIKIEYRHVNPDDFCKGRGSFLEGMASGEKSPFFTETMKSLRGEQTMKNMKWEMEELKKGIY